MTDKTLHISILAPDGPLHEGEARAVFLPGTLSPFEVLPGHAPIISALSAGQIRVVAEEELRFAIRGGVVKVKDNDITACVETA